jgi:hypothetical protein
VRVLRIEEPELFFAEGRKCTDPQVGLLNFGPHGGTTLGKNEKVTITAGIIGTTRSICATDSFLNRLKVRISAVTKSKTEYKGIDFPGLGIDSSLRFQISLDENCIVKIERDFVRSLTKLSRKERIIKLVDECCAKFDVLTEAHPKPDIVFLPIDDELLSLCKDPQFKINRIVYQRRDFGDPQSSKAPLFDFHHHMKAQAAKRNFVTQVLLPETLTFSEQKQSPALIAWNFSVGTYYKATGVPWKLADIDDNTCYVGISFYREITKETMTMRASIAQVYMRTGESQVISGRPFEWNREERGRLVQLTSSQMSELVNDSINIFKKQRDKLPKRLVVHKSSHFYEEEIQGCEEGSKNVDEIDIVHISENTDFRAYHRCTDFPIVRGTMITANEKSNESMLFTSGYVPALGTYPGPTAPRPLHIVSQRTDTSMEMICKDILGLSKLDWNSSTFYTKLPVTIGVSAKVGNILAEMTLVKTVPPSNYRYYM